MDTPTEVELRAWSIALSPDPIDPDAPGEERYVPLSGAGRGAVEELRSTILLALDPTTQLLSGPSGSGKTTELFRLRGELEKSGLQVAMIDITRYISQTTPVDITEFLIALAIGAHDQLGEEKAEQQGFGIRLRRFLQRFKISLDIPGFAIEASRDGVTAEAFGAEVELDLQRELKSSGSVVDQLRAKLTYHIGELYDEVSDFLAALLPVDDPGQGSVLIVDGLEKLSGTIENDKDVQESIQALFVTQAGKLRFRSHHVVYTVPTYLQFVAPGALPYSSRVIPVPVPYVRPRSGDTTSAAARGVAELCEVVGRRIPVGRFFAGTEQLERIVFASGGHLRDLFALLRQLINLTLSAALSLPVRDEHIDAAIARVGHDFSLITAEQADFLRRVAAGDGTVQPADAEVQLMARLLQSHMLLGHMNGQDWYEVHPLARRALELPDP